VVRNGTLSKNAFRNTSAILTTPSAPLRWLRIFFLMAQPPLLYQEGSYLSHIQRLCSPDVCPTGGRRPRRHAHWHAMAQIQDAKYLAAASRPRVDGKYPALPSPDVAQSPPGVAEAEE
jgi:hypothetical protein